MNQQMTRLPGTTDSATELAEILEKLAEDVRAGRIAMVGYVAVGSCREDACERDHCSMGFVIPRDVTDDSINVVAINGLTHQLAADVETTMRQVATAHHIEHMQAKYESAQAKANDSLQ